MYYGIIFIILVFISGYSFYNPDSVLYSKFKVIAFLLLFCTSGLRYETAVDWVNYKSSFEEVDNIFHIFNYGITGFFLRYPSEPLFTILNAFLRTFTDNVQVLFFIVSLCTTSLLFKSLTFFTEKKFFFFSVILYYVLIFFILDMSGIRQAIALNILLYAFKSLTENKLYKYFFLVVISVMFYFLVFIFVVGFLLKKKINVIVIANLVMIGLAVFVFRIRWMVNSIDGLFSLFSDNYVYMRLFTYTTSESVVSKERPIFLMLFINVFLYLFYLYGREKYLKKDIVNTLFFNLYTLFILSTLFLWEISDFGVRFGLYFSLGIVICLPYILDFFKKDSKFYILCFVILYSFNNARTFFLEDRTVISYNPYQNYIVYELFGLNSTGVERRDTYVRESEN